MNDLFWWRWNRTFLRFLWSWVHNFFWLDWFSLNGRFMDWRRGNFSFFFGFFWLWFSGTFDFGFILEFLELDWFDISGGFEACRLRTNIFIFFLFSFLFFLHDWKINNIPCMLGLSFQLFCVVSKMLENLLRGERNILVENLMR